MSGQLSSRVMMYGGAGAVINGALSLYSMQNIKTLSLESRLSSLVEVVLVEPLAALSPIALGFFVGTVILVIWSLLRALAVRFLLGCNGWFLNRKNPLNKVRDTTLAYRFYLFLTCRYGIC